ncbi:MAG: hypothetical protein WAT12_04090 [Candidatus Nitrotoga sp.]
MTSKTVQMFHGKQQIEPALKLLKALPVELGKPDNLEGVRATSSRPTSIFVVNSNSPH